jgi:hypothetical protein
MKWTIGQMREGLRALHNAKDYFYPIPICVTAEERYINEMIDPDAEFIYWKIWMTRSRRDELINQLEAGIEARRISRSIKRVAKNKNNGGRL